MESVSDQVESLSGNDLFGMLVECVQDYAIFALDRTGHVLTWNAGAQRIKGYAPPEIIGQHFSVFYPPEDLAAGKTEMELREASRVGRFEDEGWRIRKDGSRFWANVVITALRDHHGTLIGFGKVTRDLTERHAAAERALVDARRVAAAEAASRAKSEFLAMLSHELRTPLNAIGGYAELMAMGVAGPLTEQHREFIARIQSSQRHLLAVIEDLLNYSRVESGKATFATDPVSLHAVVGRALEMIALQAAEAGLSVHHGGCDPDAIARADEPRVEQIVLNLLSNAVKFTAAGGSLSVRCDGAGDRVSISVVDTGQGVPEDKLDAIFEPFVQLGRAFARPVEGTGLGLAISRHLAEGMGGTLTVESTLGHGSTFVLTLPRAADGTKQRQR